MASKPKKVQSKDEPPSNLRIIDNASLPEMVAPNQDLPQGNTASLIETVNSNDPLDLGRMRLNPAKLVQTLGIKAAHVRVGRPDDQDFFMVRSGDEWTMDTYLLRMKNDREFYYVADALWQDARVLRELKLYRLYFYTHYSRAVGLWPVMLPDEAGNQNSWHASAMVIADKAMAGWIRLLSGSGGYMTIDGDEIEEEPVWPAMTFDEVIKTAFRPKLITDLEHPKIKQLWGKKK